MQDFHELKVWQKAHAFTLHAYAETQQFPKHELYGLTAQIRRACVSIGSNICEGSGRGTLPEFTQFCQGAFGSATEVEYQLLLARDLSYLPEGAYRELHSEIVEVKRMLGALLTTLRERSGRPRTKGFVAYGTPSERKNPN